MRLTIGRKVLLANVVIIAGLCSVLAWLLVRMQHMDELIALAADAQDQVQNIGAIGQDTEELRRVWGTSLSILQARSLGDVSRWHSELNRRTAAITHHRDSLLAVVEASPFAQRQSMRQGLQHFHQASDDLFGGVFGEVERRINMGMAEDAESMMTYWRGPARATQEALDRLRDQASADARALVAESDSFRKEFVTNAAAALGGAALLALVTFFVLGHGIRRSTRKLDAAMHAVAEGNLHSRVDITAHDEFRDLARGFNAMSKRLGELDELKSDFLSNVSHELRTPIASVKQSAQLMQEGLLGPMSDEQEEMVDIILSNSKRLSALINNLLDTAKLEAGRIELSPEPTDLPELVRSIVKTVAPLAQEKDLTVSLHADADMPLVPLDPVRIEQVVTNLLSNAIKFTPEGGTINLKCIRQDGCAVCAVEDSGVGIPREELPYVFDKFHQVRATKTRRTKGTGLGLTIVRHLIQAHGGSINVRSQQGEGTTFTFTLPLTAVGMSAEHVVGESDDTQGENPGS